MTTLTHKIAAAVMKIGTLNGTKVSEPKYGGDERSNSAIEKWFDEWKVLAEFLVASTAKKAAESREKRAREDLSMSFGPTLANVKVGSKLTLVRGNVSVTFDRRNAGARISRASIIKSLTTTYKWKLEDIEKFLNEVEEVSPNGALHITAAPCE